MSGRVGGDDGDGGTGGSRGAYHKSHEDLVLGDKGERIRLDTLVGQPLRCRVYGVWSKL